MKMISRRHLLQATCVLPWASEFTRAAQRGQAAGRPSFNPAIDAAWQAGLTALKPSDKDIEHGLQLHADALVFDAYGFSPRAAVDGDRIAKAVAAGASDGELQDLQEDMGMTRCVESAAERAEFELDLM